MSNLDFLNQFKNIIFCAYAPGGANVLFGVEQNISQEKNKFFLMEGPALNLLPTKVKDPQIIDSTFFKSLEPKNTVLITGLSGNHDFELDMIELAKKHTIFCISCLDHWSNYEMRLFKQIDKNLKHRAILSDLYLLSDNDAVSLFQNLPLLKNLNYRQIPSYYLDSESMQVSLLSEKTLDKNKILFISEYFSLPNPTAETPITEEMSILKEFCEQFYFKYSNQKKLVIRLHPYESPNKYRFLSDIYPDLEITGVEIPLYYDLASAQWIVGFHSFAMAIAVRAGKAVYSIAKNRNNLPLTEIRYCDTYQEFFEAIK